MIELQTLLSLVNNNHTELQMDRFITIKSGGTTYGCLFQSLRELYKRYRGLVSQHSQLARLRIKIEHLTGKLSDSNSVQQRLLKLKIIDYQFALDECLKQQQSLEREFLRFYSQASSLYELLGFDKEFPTDAKLQSLEEERWEYRILADAALSLMTTGTINGSVMSMIQCLPVKLRAKICDKCFGNSNNPQSKQQSMSALIDWFMTYEFAMPEPKTLTEVESREILACCELSSLPNLLENSLPLVATLLPEINMKLDSVSANLVIRESAYAAESVAAL